MLLQKPGCEVWTGFMRLRAGSCEHTNELSDPIKGKEFVDWVGVLLASQGLLHGVKFSYG
jgi:hypothetical protein